MDRLDTAYIKKQMQPYKARHTSLWARQSTTCEPNSCDNALTAGSDNCDIEDATIDQVLSCYCPTYYDDLFNCLSYCSDGESFPQILAVLVNGCALYESGDTSDAENCLASGEIDSTYCQTGLSDESSSSTTVSLVPQTVTSNVYTQSGRSTGFPSSTVATGTINNNVPMSIGSGGSSASSGTTTKKASTGGAKRNASGFKLPLAIVVTLTLSFALCELF